MKTANKVFAITEDENKKLKVYCMINGISQQQLLRSIFKQWFNDECRFDHQKIQTLVASLTELTTDGELES